MSESYIVKNLYKRVVDDAANTNSDRIQKIQRSFSVNLFKDWFHDQLTEIKQHSRVFGNFSRPSGWLGSSG